MKKLLIALSIILALSLTFVACNKNNEEATTAPDTTANVTEEATEAASIEESSATTADVTTADTEAPETTAATTEETTLTETDGETTLEVTTEETTVEETTIDETLVSAEEVSSIFAEVDKVMGEITEFKKTTTTTSDGFIASQSVSSVHFDGLYAHVSNDTEDIYFMYDTINIIVSSDGEELLNVVTFASESERAYFLDTYVTYDNEFESATAIFNKFNLTRGENGEYVILCSSPKAEYLAGMVEGGSQMIDEFSVKIVINEDYSIVYYETFIKASVDMVGEIISLTSNELCEYDYDVDFVEPPTEQFDGYTVIEFEDCFGYMDTSYGRDLGLDVNSDNYVIDYANEERALKQLDFLSTYMDEYVGKSFTMYGVVEEFVEGLYCVNIHGRYITLIPTDGISLTASSLVCVKGTLECVSESLEAYELNVDSVSVIAESDLPEGGYNYWTAFVTAKTLNVRSSADFTADNKVGVLNQNTEVKIVGFIEPKYCLIEYHWETADGQSGEYAYVSLAYLSKLPTFYITLDENYKPVNPPV